MIDGIKKPFLGVNAWRYYKQTNVFNKRILEMHTSANFNSITLKETTSLSLTVIALCCYPNVKVEFRDSSQICTTAPIFMMYFTFTF